METQGEPFFADSAKNAVVGDIWIETHDGVSILVAKTEKGLVYGPRMNVDLGDVDFSEVTHTHSHVHRDADGFLHRCYHKCRSLLSWQFFAGLTLSFPIEHALWTKVTPFMQIAEFLGLGISHHH